MEFQLINLSIHLISFKDLNNITLKKDIIIND